MSDRFQLPPGAVVAPLEEDDAPSLRDIRIDTWRASRLAQSADGQRISRMEAADEVIDRIYARTKQRLPNPYQGAGWGNPLTGSLVNPLALPEWHEDHPLNQFQRQFEELAKRHPLEDLRGLATRDQFEKRGTQLAREADEKFARDFERRPVSTFLIGAGVGMAGRLSTGDPMEVAQLGASAAGLVRSGLFGLSEGVESMARTRLGTGAKFAVDGGIQNTIADTTNALRREQLGLEYGVSDLALTAGTGALSGGVLGAGGRFVIDERFGTRPAARARAEEAADLNLLMDEVRWAASMESVPEERLRQQVDDINRAYDAELARLQEQNDAELAAAAYQREADGQAAGRRAMSMPADGSPFRPDLPADEMARATQRVEELQGRRQAEIARLIAERDARIEQLGVLAQSPEPSPGMREAAVETLRETEAAERVKGHLDAREAATERAMEAMGITPDDESFRQLDEAEALLRDVADEVEPQRVREAVDTPPARLDAAADGERIRFRGQERSVSMRRVAPGDLSFDAPRFQYKRSEGAQGQTGTLRGVEEWDPGSSGKVVVWEDEAGQQFVADGHQRVALAQRLDVEELDAVVLREADGWTAQDARHYAGKKNLAEGSGDPVDVATLLKEAPDILDRSVPVSSRVMRIGRALSRLHPTVLGMVRNDVLSADLGAVIGRVAPDDPEMHIAIAQAFVKDPPATQAEASNIVNMVLAAPRLRQEVEQMALFGETPMLSGFAERAKILQAALRELRQNRRLFKLANERAAELEAKGNVIARDANDAGAQRAAILVDQLERLAVRHGPVSDALKDATERALYRKTPIQEAARTFAAELARLVETHGIDGLVRNETVQRPPADPAPLFETIADTVRQLDVARAQDMDATALRSEMIEEAVMRAANGEDVALGDLFAAQPVRDLADIDEAIKRLGLDPGVRAAAGRILAGSPDLEGAARARMMSRQPAMTYQAFLAEAQRGLAGGEDAMDMASLAKALDSVPDGRAMLTVAAQIEPDGQKAALYRAILNAGDDADGKPRTHTAVAEGDQPIEPTVDPMRFDDETELFDSLEELTLPEMAEIARRMGVTDLDGSYHELTDRVMNAWYDAKKPRAAISVSPFGQPVADVETALASRFGRALAEAKKNGRVEIVQSIGEVPDDWLAGMAARSGARVAPEDIEAGIKSGEIEVGANEVKTQYVWGKLRVTFTRQGDATFVDMSWRGHMGRSASPSARPQNAFKVFSRFFSTIAHYAEGKTGAIIFSGTDPGLSDFYVRMLSMRNLQPEGWVAYARKDSMGPSKQIVMLREGEDPAAYDRAMQRLTPADDAEALQARAATDDQIVSASLVLADREFQVWMAIENPQHTGGKSLNTNNDIADWLTETTGELITPGNVSVLRTHIAQKLGAQPPSTGRRASSTTRMLARIRAWRAMGRAATAEEIAGASGKTAASVKTTLTHLRQGKIRDPDAVQLFEELTAKYPDGLLSRPGQGPKAAVADPVSVASTQGYEGTDAGEAQSWLNAKAKGLDLSRKARMERAAAQGWQGPVFRGMTEQVDDVQFRATVSHAHQGYGVSTTKEPVVASEYAGEGAVYPIMWRGKALDQKLFDQRVEAIVRDEGVSYKDAAKRAIDQFRAQGFTALASSTQAEVRIWADADGRVRNIRSVHAAFDPDETLSPDLLAAVADGRTAALAARGKVYLIADNIPKGQEASFFLHDLGVHVGMPEILGETLWTRVLDDVRDAMETDPDIMRGAAYARNVDVPASRLPEEALAYAIQDYENLRADAPIRRVVDRVVATVRAWLWRNFPAFRDHVRLTVADYHALAIGAMRRAARTEPPEVRDPEAPRHAVLDHKKVLSATGDFVIFRVDAYKEIGEVLKGVDKSYQDYGVRWIILDGELWISDAQYGTHADIATALRVNYLSDTYKQAPRGTLRSREDWLDIQRELAPKAAKSRLLDQDPRLADYPGLLSELEAFRAEHGGRYQPDHPAMKTLSQDAQRYLRSGVSARQRGEKPALPPNKQATKRVPFTRQKPNSPTRSEH